MNPIRTLCLSALSLAVAAPAAAQTDPAQNPPTVGQPGVDSDGDNVNDDVDAQPCNPSISARVSVPADRTWGMLLFEDLWPDRGDFDFNDLVLAYNETLDLDSSAQLRSLRIDLRVMAVGARLGNGLALRLPGVPRANVTQLNVSVAGQGVNASLRSTDADAVVTLVDDLHALFGDVSTREWINTDPNAGSRAYVEITVQVQLSAGHSLDIAGAPFDLFLFNLARGTEVHLPRYGGTAGLNGALVNTGDDATIPGRAFVTSNGIPFALEFPETVVYPREGERIDSLFPEIVTFGATSGQQAATFYRNPSTGFAYGNVSLGSLAAAVSADVSCFAPEPGICGAANGSGRVDAPSAGLCSFGTATTVSSAGGFWRWSCAGNYSAPTTCDAPDWVCAPNVASSCSVSNGTGTRTCNGSGTGYNACTVASCNSGYYASGNTCQPQVCAPNSTTSCAIANGTGTQQCNNLGSAYGGCQVLSCNAGYAAENNACVSTVGTGRNVYYQCANVERTYGLNSGYVVFVENVDGRRTNTPQELLNACLHYGFRGLASSDSRTHRNNGWGTANSSQLHQAVYCHNCYPSSGNEWYFNRSNYNSCTHVTGIARNVRNLHFTQYVFNSDDTTFACMTFDQDLDGSTAFGNGQTNDAVHPWYTESSGQDPCNRTRNRFADQYNGTPDYLLCASPTIQN